MSFVDTISWNNLSQLHFGFKTNYFQSKSKIHRLSQFLQLIDWFISTLRLRNKETTLGLVKKIDRFLVGILFI